MSKAGENGLGSITLNYDGTGASKATDGLGMRAMQARVWDKRDAQHLLVKSPPASGKSRAAMFIGLEKLRAGAVDRVVIAVPERSIGASFRNTGLAAGGFHSDWLLNLDLCTVGSETGRKVEELIAFLRGGEGHRTALCTHSTLRAAYAGTNDVALFDRALVCVDELHHASSDENSRLGNLLRGLIDRAGETGHDAAHILVIILHEVLRFLPRAHEAKQIGPRFRRGERDLDGGLGGVIPITSGIESRPDPGPPLLGHHHLSPAIH